MPNSMFNQDGRLHIPKSKSIKKVVVEKKEAVEIKEAYCPKGHNLITTETVIDGFPGIRMGFRRKNGEEGEFVVSAILGKYGKEILRRSS